MYPEPLLITERSEKNLARMTASQAPSLCCTALIKLYDFSQSVSCLFSGDGSASSSHLQGLAVKMPVVICEQFEPADFSRDLSSTSDLCSSTSDLCPSA